MNPIKQLVVGVMNRAVAEYLRRNRVRVVAVAGSIGKTSTVNAIRTVLSQKYRVHMPRTAYNVTRSVHLELFDLEFATTPFGWLVKVAKVLIRSMGSAPYQVVVIELGTDYPGELKEFAWLRPHIGVLTAIAPEHMEYFQTMEAVAKEELTIGSFSKTLMVNANMVAYAAVPQTMAGRTTWYGSGTAFVAGNYQMRGSKVTANFTYGDAPLNDVELQVLGLHSLDALTAATAVASRFGLTPLEAANGLRAVQPVSGRMQPLRGLQDSLLIDDSYNASPEACKAALDLLAACQAGQRIAVLGSMNEMGQYSSEAHREVGAYCNPARIDTVVTIGKEASQFLAPAARSAGCEVESFDNPYEAGDYVKRHLKSGAAVLFKGSQNGVFAEEAIKAVLADPADEARLVRQSAYWLAQKKFEVM